MSFIDNSCASNSAGLAAPFLLGWGYILALIATMVYCFFLSRSTHDASMGPLRRSFPSAGSNGGSNNSLWLMSWPMNVSNPR